MNLQNQKVIHQDLKKYFTFIVGFRILCVLPALSDFALRTMQPKRSDLILTREVKCHEQYEHIRGFRGIQRNFTSNFGAKEQINSFQL